MIAFAVIGWVLFVALLSFFLGAKIVSNAQETRCKERGLCSECLNYRDPITRTLAEMINEDTEAHKARAKDKSDEHKA